MPARDGQGVARLSQVSKAASSSPPSTRKAQRAIRTTSGLLLSGPTGLGSKARNATPFTLVTGSTAPKIVPSTDAPRRLLRTGTGAAVARKAIEAGARSSVDRCPSKVTHPAFTTADAKQLGITEAVGTTTTWDNQPQVKSFTTYYPGGTPQVTNVHRIADLVRGAVVKPGATFSIDQRVGPRTTARGFVAAAADDGDHVNAVGGGVSYFATALFNAAFFAGLDFGEHQNSTALQLPQRSRSGGRPR